VVLLIGSLYLMKASTTTTLLASNLAYDAQLSKAADLGLHTGAQWLAANGGPADKVKLQTDSSANGYVAMFNNGWAPTSGSFWNGSVKITDSAQNQIEYVIHRLCAAPGPSTKPNTCVQTTEASPTGAQIGASMAQDAAPIPAPPQIHYVITARLSGPRGGHVINQMVVMIGA
jgi:hypothetical protein